MERKELMQQLIAEGKTKPIGLLTVMFDDETEYVRFVREAYQNFNRQGLEFTNVPIITSVRIRPWLLEKTWEAFDFRSVTQEDLDKVREKYKDFKPWDPETLKGWHVPGFIKPKEIYID